MEESNNIYDLYQNQLLECIQKNLNLNGNDSECYKIKFELKQSIREFSNSGSFHENIINSIKQVLSNIKSPYQLLDQDPNIQYDLLNSPTADHQIFNPIFNNLEYTNSLIEKINSYSINISNNSVQSTIDSNSLGGSSSSIGDNVNTGVGNDENCSNFSILISDDSDNSKTISSNNNIRNSNNNINNSNNNINYSNNNINNSNNSNNSNSNSISNYSNSNSDNSNNSNNSNNNIETLKYKLSQLYQFYSNSINDFINKLVNSISISKNTNIFKLPPVLISQDRVCYQFNSLDLAYQISSYDQVENHQFKLNDIYIQDASEISSKVYYKVYHGSDILKSTKENAVYQFYQLLFPNSSYVSPSQLIVIDKLKVFQHVPESPLQKEYERLRDKYQLDSIQEILKYQPKFRAKIENGLSSKKNLFIHASLVKDGISLREYLEESKDDQHYGSINPNSFSAHFIASLLLQPTEFHQDNLILEKDTGNIIGVGIDKVMSIDEVTTNSNDANINFKNILFAMDSLMSRAIDSNVRKQFIHHNPSILVSNWLLELQSRQSKYESLLSMLNISSDQFEFKLEFSESWIVLMYERFKMIKELLVSNSDITHKELLEMVHPLTSIHYQYLLHFKPTPVDRISSISSNQYTLNELLENYKSKLKDLFEINPDSETLKEIYSKTLLDQDSVMELINQKIKYQSNNIKYNPINVAILELINNTFFEDLLECQLLNEKCNERCGDTGCKSNDNIVSWLKLVYSNFKVSNVCYNESWGMNKKSILSRLFKSNAPRKVIEGIMVDLNVSEGQYRSKSSVNVYVQDQINLSNKIGEYSNKAYYHNVKVELLKLKSSIKDENIISSINNIIEIVKQPQKSLHTEQSLQNNFINSPNKNHPILIPLITNLNNFKYGITFISNIIIKNKLLKLYVYYSQSHYRYINNLVDQVLSINLNERSTDILKAPPLLFSEDLNYYEINSLAIAYKITSYCTKVHDFVRTVDPNASQGQSIGAIIDKKFYSKVAKIDSRLLNPAKEHAVYQFYKFLSLNPSTPTFKLSDTLESSKLPLPISASISTPTSTYISPTQLLVIDNLKILPGEELSEEFKEFKALLNSLKSKHHLTDFKFIYEHEPEFRDKVDKSLKSNRKVFIQASLYRDGISLEKYLNHQGSINNSEISMESYSTHIIASLLLFPTDYHPNNLLVENGTNNIIGIDNDDALEADEFLPSTNNSNGVNNDKQSDPKEYLNGKYPCFKNSLFVLKSLMSKPIDSRVRQQFINHNPSLFIFKWLLELKSKQSNYESLLSESITANQLFEKDQQVIDINIGQLKNEINLPLKFKKGWIKIMYERFTLIKNLLESNLKMTHQSLFEKVLPLTSIYYQLLSNIQSNPIELIRSIYKREYSFGALLENNQSYQEKVEKEFKKLVILSDNRCTIDETIKEFIEYISSNDLVECQNYLYNEKYLDAETIYIQLDEIIKETKNKNTMAEQISDSKSISANPSEENEKLLKFSRVVSNFSSKSNTGSPSTNDISAYQLEGLIDIDFSNIPKNLQLKVFEMIRLRQIYIIRLVNSQVKYKQIRTFALIHVIKLNLSGCKNLQSLDDSPLIKLSSSLKLKLPSLRRLIINDCVNLSIVKLYAPYLTGIDAANCRSLYSLELEAPQIIHLNLKNSIVYHHSIPSQIFNQFTKLEYLNISSSGYNKLSLTLPQLKSLDISSMSNLEDATLKVESILKLSLDGCIQLKSISGFTGADSDKNLHLKNILNRCHNNNSIIDNLDLKLS